MTDPMRGIFPVLQTPLDAQGELDATSLRREVDFCVRAGAHGLVYPVLGGEFQFLSDAERQRMVEVVLDAAGGRVPVVVGVAGPSTPVAVEHARHAKRVRADAVIALPPYVSSASQSELLAYYRAIGEAADMPVFVQHTNPGMDAAFLVRLLREVEHVRYIKEEQPPSAHNVSAVVKAVGDECLGVFGGGHDRWMLSELARGGAGFMPAAEATDIHVQVWEAYQAGDQAKARRLFNQLLPLINLILLLGLRVCKEILVRRGVFQTSLLRTPGALVLDDEDLHELDAVLAGVSPLFRV